MIFLINWLWKLPQVAIPEAQQASYWDTSVEKRINNRAKLKVSPFFIGHFQGPGCLHPSQSLNPWSSLQIQRKVFVGWILWPFIKICQSGSMEEFSELSNLCYHSPQYLDSKQVWCIRIATSKHQNSNQQLPIVYCIAVTTESLAIVNTCDSVNEIIS